MATPAIRARELGKQYRKGADTHGRLIHWLRTRGQENRFWALRDLTFDVEQGEMLGVVGANGAGKSTLLKIISRITRPNAGEVEVRGRVGSLLEVGTGFHPELTGRENIYLNGALIGMARRDIDRSFDEIVAFSGVEEFLDTPLKRYSTGMKVRLGFAVAVNLRQEIMLVDEVLSVGDAAFREKCMVKMDEVTGHGRTVIFVGHNLEMVRSNCQRAIWLDHGRMRAEGVAEDVVRVYEESAVAERAGFDGFVSLADRSDHRGDEGVLLTHVRLLDEHDRLSPHFEAGQHARLAIGYEVSGEQPISGVTVSLTIQSGTKHPVSTFESNCVRPAFDELTGTGELVCEFEKLPLMPGRYRLALKCRVGPRVAHSIPNAGELHVTEGAFYPMDPLPTLGGGSSLLDHRWSEQRPGGG